MSDASSTTITQPRWINALMWLGFPLLGAGLGLGIKALAHWIATLPWAPFQGLFRAVDSIDDPYATLGTMLLGAAAGLVMAVVGALESVSVVVDPTAVTVKRGLEKQSYPADRIASGFLDNNHMVLLGRDGTELIRRKCDLRAEDLRAALTEHGYDFLDADPYADDYRRWVPDTPGLPIGADALLKARDKALAKNDEDDVAELREELRNLGVVVRDKRSVSTGGRSTEVHPNRSVPNAF